MRVIALYLIQIYYKGEVILQLNCYLNCKKKLHLHSLSHQTIFCHLSFLTHMFEIVPVLVGKPKDFRAFNDSFGLPIFSLWNWIFFCNNFSAWYLASFYKSSSICNFVDLNCFRCFSLSFVALATLSMNQSWVLFLILRSKKGATSSMRSKHAILTLSRN